MTQTTINIVAVICMEIGWTDAIRRTWSREGHVSSSRARRATAAIAALR